MDELNKNGFIKLNISIGEITLFKEDLLIESEQKAGFFTLTDGGVTVAIDTELTPELIEEGMVREVISKLQTMRKDSGFEVMDHIKVAVSGSEKVLGIIENNKEQIAHDVLAEDISAADAENAKEWDINGEKVAIAVEKV